LFARAPHAEFKAKVFLFHEIRACKLRASDALAGRF